MKAKKANNRPRRSKRATLQQTLLQIFTIVPTSWNLFVAFCSVFGVVEIVGPFFRYLIVSWKIITRQAWDYIFGNFLAGFNITLTESDKDGLTLCFFFAIFGASAVPNYFKVFSSKSYNEIRKVDWRLFPIASSISAAMVALVVSTTTAGSLISSASEIPSAGQIAFYFVMATIIYTFVAFLPTFATYIVSYAFSKDKQIFKTIAPIIMLGYAMLWASWIPYHTQSLNVMSSFGVTIAVTLVCLFVPLWMPIAQPEKLIKVLAVTVFIGVIAYLSYGVDYLKYKASIPGYSLNQQEKIQAETIADACRKNFIAIIMLRSIAEKKDWQRDPMLVCDCLGEQIVAQEDETTILKISNNLSAFLDLTHERQAEHYKHCLPL